MGLLRLGRLMEILRDFRQFGFVYMQLSFYVTLHSCYVLLRHKENYVTKNREKIYIKMLIMI